MNSSRAAFLERVRTAVRAGNQAGSIAAIGPRGQTGYLGAGADPAARFCEQFAAAGGIPHVVADVDAARARIVEIVTSLAAPRTLCGIGAVLDALHLREALPAFELHFTEAVHEQNERDTFFAADVGITGVDFLIAETGSLVVSTAAAEPRSLSLLPPVHIAVATREQILPDLFDLFERFPSPLPSCVTIITGPSKTGDIELRLVTGVHGPGTVHVILIG